MTNLIVPEELSEILKEIVVYEEIERITEEEFEWAQEWLYVDLPVYDPLQDTEESWKIEIET